MGTALNDLKALAVTLPPSERVDSGSLADVLSALVAVQNFGDEVVTAAKEGKIADFFHEIAVKHAKDNGHPEPVRGAVNVEPTQPVAQTSQSDAKVDALSADVAALRGDVASLVAALSGNHTQAAGTPIETTPEEGAS